MLRGQAGSLLDGPAPREAHSSFLLLSQCLSCLFSQETYSSSSNYSIFEFSVFPSSTHSSVPPAHPVTSSVGSMHTPIFHPPCGGLLDGEPCRRYAYLMSARDFVSLGWQGRLGN